MVRYRTVRIALCNSDSKDRELARRLLKLCDEGQGISKSELERQIWDDDRAHGKRFDSFYFETSEY